MEKVLVIDSSVLVDMFVEDEPRHAKALKIANYLVEKGIRPMVPMHQLFELYAAIKNIGLVKGSLNLEKSFQLANPIAFETVDITEAFLQHYFDPALPYIKAGDLIILSVAKRENANFITEDKKLYKAATNAGVKAYTIDEFIAAFVKK